jgi:hypothetical protein
MRDALCGRTGYQACIMTSQARAGAVRVDDLQRGVVAAWVPVCHWRILRLVGADRQSLTEVSVLYSYACMPFQIKA